MHIDWDLPIEMDDGVVLRADVFRPDGDGRYPVLMTHGPYGKGLAFQEGFAGMWRVIEGPGIRRFRRGRRTGTRTGKRQIRRSGCRRGMCACGWTRAEPGVRPGSWTRSRPGRPAISASVRIMIGTKHRLRCRIVRSASCSRSGCARCGPHLTTVRGHTKSQVTLRDR